MDVDRPTAATGAIAAAGTPEQLGAQEIGQLLPYVDAVDALAAAFARDRSADNPPRTHLALPGGEEVLLMPAYGPEGFGVKLVTLNGANPERGLPLIHGTYVLFNAETLAPELVIDGSALTALRTAAVSALATRHLARPDARRLVIFGGGVQAAAHIEAMCAVRPIDQVTIVGTHSDRTTRLIESTRRRGIAVRRGTPDAVAEADIVCTCTTSSQPLFASAMLAPGAHVNAVGAYRPDRRELEGSLLSRASLLVVETREVAAAEAGDILLAIADGAISESDIAGELADVVRGDIARTGGADITVFKSVGMAVEDLVIARAAAQRIGVGLVDGSRRAQALYRGSS